MTSIALPLSSKYYAIVKYISDLLSNLDEIVNITSNDTTRIFFRGVSNVEYLPLPSIIYSSNQLKEPDYTIISKKYFNLAHSNTQYQSIMQHFGLPTRLLDFSSNFLIALYFACKGNLDKDGRLMYFYYTSQECDISQRISEFYLELTIDYWNKIMYSYDGIQVISYFENSLVVKLLDKYNLTFRDLVTYYRKPLVITNNNLIDRQIKQRSVLVSSSNMIIGKLGSSSYYTEISSEEQDDFLVTDIVMPLDSNFILNNLKSIRIPSILKKHIISFLKEVFKIDENYLFADSIYNEDEVQEIVNKVDSLWKKIKSK